MQQAGWQQAEQSFGLPALMTTVPDLPCVLSCVQEKGWDIPVHVDAANAGRGTPGLAGLALACRSRPAAARTSAGNESCLPPRAPLLPTLQAWWRRCASSACASTSACRTWRPST